VALLSRPWFRLTAVGVLALVGIVVSIVVLVFATALTSPAIPLPYQDSFVSQSHVMQEWDNEVTRARYATNGYEVLVKQPGRTAASIPETWYEWDLSIEVTVDVRGLGVGPWSDSDSVPTAGVICTGDDADYDFRVGADGRYAVYRWTGSGVERQAELLASNATLAVPKIVVGGPMRLVVICQRRSPTTLRLTVDGTELLSVVTTDARNWGRAGVIVGSGMARDVSAVFWDLSIAGH
jgi:hypothetical protein